MRKGLLNVLKITNYSQNFRTDPVNLSKSGDARGPVNFMKVKKCVFAPTNGGPHRFLIFLDFFLIQYEFQTDDCISFIEKLVLLKTE